MAAIVILGIKGEGAGSAHALARRAIARMKVLHIPHASENKDVMHDHTHAQYQSSITKALTCYYYGSMVQWFHISRVLEFYGSVAKVLSAKLYY